ncbi:hypothetical protein IAE22_31350, partial [Bacillus sp. S34]|nr:hypothetical protein [Bacillus sp. S34]
DSMSTDFDPDRYTDSYQAELQQLIDAKLEAGDDIDTEKTFGEQPGDDDEGEGGDVIGKETKNSVRKIDAAMAATLVPLTRTTARAEATIEASVVHPRRRGSRPWRASGWVSWSCTVGLTSRIEDRDREQAGTRTGRNGDVPVRWWPE